MACVVVSKNINGVRSVHLDVSYNEMNADKMIEILTSIDALYSEEYTHKELNEVRYMVFGMLPRVIDEHVSTHSSLSDNTWTLIWILIKVIRLENAFYGDLPASWIRRKGLLYSKEIFHRLALIHVLNIGHIYAKQSELHDSILAFVDEWAEKNPIHDANAFDSLFAKIVH